MVKHTIEFSVSLLTDTQKHIGFTISLLADTQKQ